MKEVTELADLMSKYMETTNGNMQKLLETVGLLNKRMKVMEDRLSRAEMSKYKIQREHE